MLVLLSLEQLEPWRSNSFQDQTPEFGPSLVLTGEFGKTLCQEFGHSFGHSFVLWMPLLTMVGGAPALQIIFIILPNWTQNFNFSLLRSPMPWQEDLPAAEICHIQWLKKPFQCLPLLTFSPYISTISNSNGSQFWEKMHMFLVCSCTKYRRNPFIFDRDTQSTSYMGHWNSFFANGFVTPILQISTVYVSSLPETWHAPF